MRWFLIACLSRDSAFAAFGAAALLSTAAIAEPRARDLGVPFEGRPGALNAITDVPGVTVGQTTLIKDVAADTAKKVRTGVTVILPRGRDTLDTPAFGAVFALNGNGELTGSHWIEESGQLEGPIALTNTHSVGAVHEALIAWRVRAGGADDSGYWWSLPIVAETWDGDLNDINGFHVRAEHVFAALDAARDGPVQEGSVGGGTGMICHEFKCGIGTASRIVSDGDREYVIGALVQANYGVRHALRIAGVPVGAHLPVEAEPADDSGSIIIVIGTDAPLLPTQLKRIARRASLGLARMGSFAGNGSGDLFVAFSTANAQAFASETPRQAAFLSNEDLNPLFEAAVQASEEAIVNALVAARDMEGTQGSFVPALPHDKLVELLKAYGRYQAEE